MARVWTSADVHPGAPAYLIIAAPPDHALADLSDLAYEGEDAFYVATTDAWVERASAGGSLRVTVRTAARELFVGTVLDPPTPLAAPTLLVVHEGSRQTIEGELARGEVWPLILGPAAPPE